jgi:hypothetical protein
MKKRHLLALAFTTALIPPLCHAAEQFAATADPAEAAKDPDFSIQGEYTGTTPDGIVGVQVIALGEGQFEAVLSKGGLPGDGWNGEKPRGSTPGKRAEDGSVTFNKEEWTAVLKNGRITATTSADASVTVLLDRVERESPTLGAKAPEGAIMLFDGSTDSAKNWNGAKLDGDLLCEGITSVEEFGDYTLHLEFRLPWMPKARGQARGNSGLYLGGRYEVQMLDSFGLAGVDNECGGIYKTAEPLQNLCYPPLRWQTYDVEFTAAKFDDAGTKIANAKATVKHNGFVIHKNLELPAPTGGAQKKAEQGPGPLHLQNHGNPVRYRNIWLLKK